MHLDNIKFFHSIIWKSQVKAGATEINFVLYGNMPYIFRRLEKSNFKPKRSPSEDFSLSWSFVFKYHLGNIFSSCHYKLVRNVNSSMDFPISGKPIWELINF